MNRFLQLSSNTTIEMISCLLDATKNGHLRSTFCFNIQCSFKTNWIKKNLKILKGQSESVYRRRTDGQKKINKRTNCDLQNQRSSNTNHTNNRR
jgi:hypothetical protein